MYAYYKKLDYFSTECIYAPFAARGFARDFVKDLEVRAWGGGAGRAGGGAQGERGYRSSGCGDWWT